MSRRASAIGLIAVFVALVTSPWFACGGGQSTAEVRHDCCAVMSAGAATDSCCLLKDASGGAAQPETAQGVGTSLSHFLAPPALSTAKDPGAPIARLGVEPAPNISSLSSLLVPLRI